MISVTNKMQQNLFFIDTFKLALHVSGDSFAHLQAHFDCIYSFGTMYRLYCLLHTGRQQTADVPKAVYTLKVLLKMGETVARNI